MKKIRELIVDELNQIKDKHLENYTQTTHWKNLEFLGLHVFKYQYESLPDHNLLEMYKLMIRQQVKPM